MIMPNCPQHMIAVYGTLRLGAIEAEPRPSTDRSPRPTRCAPSSTTMRTRHNRPASKQTSTQT